MALPFVHEAAWIIEAGIFTEAMVALSLVCRIFTGMWPWDKRIG